MASRSVLKTLLRWTNCVPLCCVHQIKERIIRNFGTQITAVATLKQLNTQTNTPPSNTELIRPVNL